MSKEFNLNYSNHDARCSQLIIKHNDQKKAKQFVFSPKEICMWSIDKVSVGDLIQPVGFRQPTSIVTEVLENRDMKGTFEKNPEYKNMSFWRLAVKDVK